MSEWKENRDFNTKSEKNILFSVAQSGVLNEFKDID